MIVIRKNDQVIAGEIFTDNVRVEASNCIIMDCEFRNIKTGIALENKGDNNYFTNILIDNCYIGFIANHENGFYEDMHVSRYREDAFRYCKNNTTFLSCSASNFIGKAKAHVDGFQGYAGDQSSNYSHYGRYTGLYALQNITIENCTVTDNSDKVQGFTFFDGQIKNSKFINNSAFLPNSNHGFSINGATTNVVLENNESYGAPYKFGKARQVEKENGRFLTWNKLPMDLDITLKNNYKNDQNISGKVTNEKTI